MDKPDLHGMREEISYRQSSLSFCALLRQAGQFTLLFIDSPFYVLKQQDASKCCTMIKEIVAPSKELFFPHQHLQLQKSK